MLIVEKLSDQYGPLINVDKGTANEPVVLLYPKVHSEEGLVDLSCLLSGVLG